MLKIKNQANETAELYISGDIVDDTEGGLIQEWRENNDATGYEFPQKIKDELKAVENKELTIYINSYGGNVFAGVALANMIARRKNKTICVCDGIVASIATQIFFCGDVCKIPSNCYLMIHKPEGCEFGNADDLRKVADTLDTIQKGLETTYQKKAKDGITAEKISELVNTETWFTGEEAAEYFDVEVLEPLKVVNCIGSAEKLKQRGIRSYPSALSFIRKPLNEAEQQYKIKAAIARAKGALL